MRVAVILDGSYTDWIPFGSPIDLQAAVADAFRREGWTVESAEFTEDRDLASLRVSYRGGVVFQTASTDTARVKARVAEIMQRITNKPAVVTDGHYTPPANTPWLAVGTLAVVGLVALAIVFVKVKP